MPTCERSPDGEHHYLFDEVTFGANNVRSDHYVCAYCKAGRALIQPAPAEPDLLTLPTDADLDKK